MKALSSPFTALGIAATALALSACSGQNNETSLKNPPVYQSEGSFYSNVGPDENGRFTAKKVKPESVEKRFERLKFSVHFHEGKMIVVRNIDAGVVEHNDGTSEPWGTRTSVTSVEDWNTVKSLDGLPDGWSGHREERLNLGGDVYFLKIQYSDFDKPYGWERDLCGQGDSLQEGDSCIWGSFWGEFAKIEVKKDGSLSLKVAKLEVKKDGSLSVEADFDQNERDGKIGNKGFKAEKTGSGWKITEVPEKVSIFDEQEQKPIGSDIPFVAGGTRVETDTDYLVLEARMLDHSKRPEAKDDKSPFFTVALADGSDPLDRDRLSRLTGTAEYRGPAFGVHTIKEAGEKAAFGEFRATARLTADFGGSAPASVTGSVTGFKVTGGTSGKGSLAGMTVQLQEAKLADDELLFKGATASGSGYDGEWGGQFFGTKEPDGKPGSVAGTFGIASGDIADDAYEGALGAFGAHRQP